MTVAKFYHLTRSPVEQAVALILGRAVAEGMRRKAAPTRKARVAWL